MYCIVLYWVDVCCIKWRLVKLFRAAPTDPVSVCFGNDSDDDEDGDDDDEHDRYDDDDHCYDDEGDS